jgi:hypothetical protein
MIHPIHYIFVHSDSYGCWGAWLASSVGRKQVFQLARYEIGLLPRGAATLRCSGASSGVE